MLAQSIEEIRRESIEKGIEERSGSLPRLRMLLRRWCQPELGVCVNTGL